MIYKRRTVKIVECRLFRWQLSVIS